VPLDVGVAHIGSAEGRTSQQRVPEPHGGEHGGGAHVCPLQKSLGALQTLPQAPQLWMSLRELTQEPSQQVKPIEQSTAQGLPPSPECAKSAGEPPSPPAGSEVELQPVNARATNAIRTTRERMSGSLPRPPV
jgi:hypothetical protein